MQNIFFDSIDFSCKHHVMIENPDGSLQPMDEPFFEAQQIAPNTWSCLSDGDYSYLVAGDKEALVIDSGYGCGNIRRFLQTVTEKPIYRIANTHHHFDHTANNCYFDCAYMSAYTKEHATIPKPSFAGIEFPRDYKTKVIEEGYIFDLGGRKLETISVPCHAEGSLAFLDRKERLLFSGDEIYVNCAIKRSVRHFLRNLEKINSYRPYFDRLCTGGGVQELKLLDDAMACAEYVLAHPEEGKALPQKKVLPLPSKDDKEEIIYKRRYPRYHDTDTKTDLDFPYKRALEYGGYTLTYDIRKIETE